MFLLLLLLLLLILLLLYFYNCRYYYCYFLYQDCLLLEIFITKRLPSFKRISTPIDIPLCFSNFHSSWPAYEPSNSVAQHRVHATHYRDVGARWLAENRGFHFL